MGVGGWFHFQSISTLEMGVPYHIKNPINRFEDTFQDYQSLHHHNRSQNPHYYPTKLHFHSYLTSLLAPNLTCSNKMWSLYERNNFKHTLHLGIFSRYAHFVRFLRQRNGYPVP